MNAPELDRLFKNVVESLSYQSCFLGLGQPFWIIEMAAIWIIILTKGQDKCSNDKF